MAPGKALGWIFCCIKPEPDTGGAQRQGSSADRAGRACKTDAPPLASYFALMLQHISDPVALFTRNGTLLANNAASETLFERMQAAGTGSCRPAAPSLHLLFSSDPDAMADAMADIAAGRTWRGLIQVTDLPPPAPAAGVPTPPLLTAVSGCVSQCSPTSSCAAPPPLLQTAVATSGGGAPWTAADIASLRFQLQVLQPERGHVGDVYDNPRGSYSQHCPPSSGPPLLAQQQEHLLLAPVRSAHSLSIPRASRAGAAAVNNAAGSMGDKAETTSAPVRRVSSQTGATPGRGPRQGGGSAWERSSAAVGAPRSGEVAFCPSERPSELLVDVLTGGGGGRVAMRGGSATNSTASIVQAVAVEDEPAGSTPAAAGLSTRRSAGPAENFGSCTWAPAAAATAAAMPGSSSAGATSVLPRGGGRHGGDTENLQPDPSQAPGQEQEQASQFHRPSRFGTAHAAAGTAVSPAPASASVVAEEPKGRVSVSALWDWKAARAALRGRARRNVVDAPASAAASYTGASAAAATAAATASAQSLRPPRRVSLDEDASFRPRWAALDTGASHHMAQQQDSNTITALTGRPPHAARARRASVDMPGSAATGAAGVSVLAVPGFGRTSLPRPSNLGTACAGAGSVQVGSRGSNSGATGVAAAGRPGPLLDVRTFLRQAEKEYAGAAAAVAAPSATGTPAGAGGAGASTAVVAAMKSGNAAAELRARGPTPSQVQQLQKQQQVPQRTEPPPPPPPSMEWQASTGPGRLHQDGTASGASPARAAAATADAAVVLPHARAPTMSPVAGGGDAAAAVGAAAAAAAEADVSAGGQQHSLRRTGGSGDASQASASAGAGTGKITNCPQPMLLRIPSLTGPSGSFRAGANGSVHTGCGSPGSASGRRSPSPLSQQSRSANYSTVAFDQQQQQQQQQDRTPQPQQQQHDVDGLSWDRAVHNDVGVTSAAEAASERERQEREMFAAERRLLAGATACDVTSSPGLEQPQRLAQDAAAAEQQHNYHANGAPDDKDDMPSGEPQSALPQALPQLPQLRREELPLAAAPGRASPPGLAPGAAPTATVCVMLQPTSMLPSSPPHSSLHGGSEAGGGGGPIALAAAAAAGTAAARRRSSWCAGAAVVGSAASSSAISPDAASGAAKALVQQNSTQSCGQHGAHHHITATARRLLFPLGPDRWSNPSTESEAVTGPPPPSGTLHSSISREGPAASRGSAAAASAGSGAAAAVAASALAAAVVAALPAVEYECDKLSYASWVNNRPAAGTNTPAAGAANALLGNLGSLETSVAGLANSSSGEVLTAESVALLANCAAARRSAAERVSTSPNNGRAAAAGGGLGGSAAAAGGSQQQQAGAVVAAGAEGSRAIGWNPGQPNRGSRGAGEQLEWEEVASHQRRGTKQPAAASAMGRSRGEASPAAAAAGDTAVTDTVASAAAAAFAQQAPAAAVGCSNSGSRARRTSLLSAAFAATNGGGSSIAAAVGPSSCIVQGGSIGGGGRSSSSMQPMCTAGSMGPEGSCYSAGGSVVEPSFNMNLTPANNRPATANGAACGGAGRAASLTVSSALALVTSANLPDSTAPLSASTRSGRHYSGDVDASTALPAAVAAAVASGAPLSSMRLPPSPHIHLLLAEAAHAGAGLEVPSSSSGRVHKAAASTLLSRSTSGVGVANSGVLITPYASGGGAAAVGAAVAGGLSGSRPAVGWMAPAGSDLAYADPAALAAAQQQQHLQLLQRLQQQQQQHAQQQQQLQQLQRQQHQEALMQGLSTSAFGAALRGARMSTRSSAGFLTSGAAGGAVTSNAARGGADPVPARAGASARDHDFGMGGSIARRQSTCIGVGASAYQQQQQQPGTLYTTAASGSGRTRSVENLMILSNASDDYSMESAVAAANARSKPLPPPQPGSRTVHFPMSRARVGSGLCADAPVLPCAPLSIRSGESQPAANGSILHRSSDSEAADPARTRATARGPAGALSPVSEGVGRGFHSTSDAAGAASPRSRSKNFLAKSLARLTSLAKVGGGASGGAGLSSTSTGMAGDVGAGSSLQQPRVSHRSRQTALSDGQVMLSSGLLTNETSADESTEAARLFTSCSNSGGAATVGRVTGEGMVVVAAAAAAGLEPAGRHASVSWGGHMTRVDSGAGAVSGPVSAAADLATLQPQLLRTFTPPSRHQHGSGSAPLAVSHRFAATGPGAVRNLGDSPTASAAGDRLASAGNSVNAPVTASMLGRQQSFGAQLLDAAVVPCAEVTGDYDPVGGTSRPLRVLESPVPKHVSAAAAAWPPSTGNNGSSLGGAGGCGGGGRTSPLPLHLGSQQSPPPMAPSAAGLAVPRIVQLTMRSMARAGAAGIAGGTSALAGARWAANGGGGNSANYASAPLGSLAAAALLDSIGDNPPSALMQTYAAATPGLCDDARLSSLGLATQKVSWGAGAQQPEHFVRSAITPGNAAPEGGEEAAVAALAAADISIRGGGIHGCVGGSQQPAADPSSGFGSSLQGRGSTSAALPSPTAGVLATSGTLQATQHQPSGKGTLRMTTADDRSSPTFAQHQRPVLLLLPQADSASSRSCSPQKATALGTSSWQQERSGGGAHRTGGTTHSFVIAPAVVADGGSAHVHDQGRDSRRSLQINRDSAVGGARAVSAYTSAGALSVIDASEPPSAALPVAGAGGGGGIGTPVTPCPRPSAAMSAAAPSTLKPAGMQPSSAVGAAGSAASSAAAVVGRGGNNAAGAMDAAQAVGSAGGGGGGGAESGSWYEVTVSAVPHPTSPGEFFIMVVQHDVSARMWAERQLARVVEAEHALLEAIFPAHVLEHIAVATMESAITAGGGAGAGAAPTAPAATQQGPGTAVAGTTDSAAAAVSGPLHITGDTFIHLATNHSMITVLFCDIQGFTGMCNSVRPGVVMAFLNDLFTRLDALLDAFGVYKVETIGDCYMVAGGLMKVDEETGAVTVRSDDVDPLHAYRTVQFAKALLQAASDVRLPTSGQPVKLRVGIHSGSAMSGVVGTRMPRFCLFGDTVNTASRMESTGEAGAIHVSKAVFDLVPGEAWEPTGGVQAKGKGQLETYLLRPDTEENVDAGATAPGF